MSNPLSSDYQQLIIKLDEFIRKYYVNRLLRGVLLLFSILSLSYLCFTVVEYFSYLASPVRMGLVLFFVVLAVGCLLVYVVKPFMAFMRLGKAINHAQAAEIIGNHFPEVKDQLLNTLQLQAMKKANPSGSALMEAAVNQKIAKLRPVPFVAAVNLSENKKYLKYALPPLAVLLALAAGAPSVLKEGTGRLINYDQHFEKAAPFQMQIINGELRALQNEDLVLNVKLIGEEIPQDIYLLEGENRYKLDKKQITEFNYTFKNLQKTQRFRLFADGYYSKEYELKVSPNPLLLNFDVSLVYPAYTKRKPEQLQNTGDLNIPAGTMVNWTFKTSNTEALTFKQDSLEEQAVRISENSYTLSKKFFKSAHYGLVTKNGSVQKNDSLNYAIEVMTDAYPAINVAEQKDSLNTKQVYFRGEVKDDYGFTKLIFNYESTLKKQRFSKVISIDNQQTSNQFFYQWDLKESGIEDGDEVTYYFEVFDNDGVNGAKSTKSALKTTKTLSTEAVTEQIEESKEGLKDKMEEAIKQAKSLEDEAKKLNEKLVEKTALTFDDKKQIKDLMEKRESLEQSIQQIQEANKQINEQDNANKELNDSIKEKQEQLEKLFDQVLDDKTKEILQNLQKMMEENNKNMSREQLENMRMDNKNVQKELDRMLELYKQLAFEQKLQEQIDKLNELAKKQEDLQKQSDSKADPKGLKSEQEQLNKEFQDMKKQQEDLQQKNQELQAPNSLEKHEEEQQEIEKEMEKSSEELGKENKAKASQSQKKAAEQMKSLSKKMQEMQEEMEGTKLDIDISALRQILENLLRSSFDQEKLMSEFKGLGINDGGFNALVQKQKGLKDNIGMVRDSIFSLSKRIPQIESFVNKESESINTYMEKTMAALAERKTGEAAGNQQYVMTSINNLAVMLSEALDQLQNQQESSGKGKPKSKGKSKQPSLSQLSKMQEDLNKQMEQMKNGQGQQQQQPGKGKESEQFAKMAQQQQAIRNALQEINRQENKDGQGKLGDLQQLAKDMEKTETELYNKRFTQEMVKRQADIKTRLLEAEKAARERDQDEQRESKAAKQTDPNSKALFDQFQKEKQKELELLKTLPPGLNPFYKNKINEYFNRLK